MNAGIVVTKCNAKPRTVFCHDNLAILQENEGYFGGVRQGKRGHGVMGKITVFYWFLKECEWHFNGGNHQHLLKKAKILVYDQ